MAFYYLGCHLYCDLAEVANICFCWFHNSDISSGMSSFFTCSSIDLRSSWSAHSISSISFSIFSLNLLSFSNFLFSCSILWQSCCLDIYLYWIIIKLTTLSQHTQKHRITHYSQHLWFCFYITLLLYIYLLHVLSQNIFPALATNIKAIPKWMLILYW